MRALVSWIGAAGAGARRVTSVCSGVFLLAAAGLATSQRVTSHWGRAEQLAREYPGLPWTATRSSSGTGGCGPRPG